MKSPKDGKSGSKPRRRYTDEFKREAVQLLIEGGSATEVARRLGLPRTNLLYRWKREMVQESGEVATSLDAQVRELQAELMRVQRERDILKKALAIFSQSD